MAELNITKANIKKRLELLLDLGNIFEKWKSVFDRCVKQFGDRKPFVFYRQRFSIVSLAAAHIAGDINVRQEIHLDPFHTVALASFAPAAFYIE